MHGQVSPPNARTVLVSYSVWDACLFILFLSRAAEMLVLSSAFWTQQGNRIQTGSALHRFEKDSLTIDCFIKTNKKKDWKSLLRQKQIEAAPSRWCGFMAGGKQHLSFCFSIKSKCWIAEQKKKKWIKIKAALLRRGSQKPVAGDAADHFNRGLGINNLHFEWAERLCHGVTENIRVHKREARRDSPWRRHRDSHQTGLSRQVGAVS